GQAATGGRERLPQAVDREPPPGPGVGNRPASACYRADRGATAAFDRPACELAPSLAEPRRARRVYEVAGTSRDPPRATQRCEIPHRQPAAPGGGPREPSH